MYTYKWQLDERGLMEAPFARYSKEQNKKNKWVEKHLSPSIHYAECGWDHCVYYVMEHPIYGPVEYVALYPEEENQNGRYIDVSCNSLGAIGEAVWNSIYK